MPKATSHFWRRVRLISQILIFSGFVYIIWATKYPLRGFVNPEQLFQLDPLVMLFTSLAERLWLPGLGLTLLTLVLTLIFGRAFCGWFCPLGAAQDFIGWLTARFRRPEPDPAGWLKSKWVVLGGLGLFAAAGIQLVWFFDPLAIFVRMFSFNFHPWVNAGVDRTAAWLLQTLNFWSPLDDGYNWLKESFLDMSLPVFPHAGIVFWIFSFSLALVLIRRRFWCRYVCPLGGLLGLVSRFALLRRETRDCTSVCGRCQDVCRTNAIRPDNRSLPEECVLCLDCVKYCPGEKTRFTFFPQRKQPSAAAEPGGGISRAQFITLLCGSVWLSSSCRPKAIQPGEVRPVLRPPAALPEDEFVQRCVRCGNCMKVCLTHVLQPAALQSGWTGIWTPRLVPEIGYCEYQCTLCGQVCPTGAIPPLTLEQKRTTKLGLAVINRELCFPWALSEPCLVCEEHCPVSQKAITALPHRTPRGQWIGLPVVNPELCVGCTICQNKCPARPERAITVVPLRETRKRPAGVTKLSGC